MDLPSSVWICSSSLAKQRQRQRRAKGDDDLLRFPSCLLYTKLVWVSSPMHHHSMSHFSLNSIRTGHFPGQRIFLQVIPFACKRKWRANGRAAFKMKSMKFSVCCKIFRIFLSFGFIDFAPGFALLWNSRWVLKRYEFWCWNVDFAAIRHIQVN